MDTIKKKVEPVLKAEYMSFEESVMEDAEEGSSSSSGEDVTTKDVEVRKCQKHLVKHQIPWRIRKFG